MIAERIFHPSVEKIAKAALIVALVAMTMIWYTTKRNEFDRVKQRSLRARINTLPLSSHSSQPSSKPTSLRTALNHGPPIDLDRDTISFEELDERTVIVAAISRNHFDEFRGMVACIHRRLLGRKVIVYDLGLSHEQQVKVRKMCDVELRVFPFNQYPYHVRNIHTYAWKPIIIQEALLEFGSIFYGDSSVRFKQPLSSLLRYVDDYHGFMHHIHTFNPQVRDAQYYMTHPKTFLELKIKRDEYKNDIGHAPWISAGRVLYVNSTSLHEKIITPMVDCALRPQCISPKGAHRGNTKRAGKDDHPHRFDSSVLSLLVYKNMRGVYTHRHNATKVFDKTVFIARNVQEVYSGLQRLTFAPYCGELMRFHKKRQKQLLMKCDDCH